MECVSGKCFKCRWPLSNFEGGCCHQGHVGNGEMDAVVSLGMNAFHKKGDLMPDGFYGLLQE